MLWRGCVIYFKFSDFLAKNMTYVLMDNFCPCFVWFIKIPLGPNFTLFNIKHLLNWSSLKSFTKKTQKRLNIIFTLYNNG